MQEYIVSIDPYHFNKISEDYADEAFNQSINKISNNDGKIYVAICDKQVVGFIMGIIENPIEEFDYIRNSKVGIVTELIVTKHIRTKGIGKLLLKEIESYFKDNNCKSVNIDVFGYNDLAIEFYHHFGYHNRMITVSKLL